MKGGRHAPPEVREVGGSIVVTQGLDDDDNSPSQGIMQVVQEGERQLFSGDPAQSLA